MTGLLIGMAGTTRLELATSGVTGQGQAFTAFYFILLNLINFIYIFSILQNYFFLIIPKFTCILIQKVGNMVGNSLFPTSKMSIKYNEISGDGHAGKRKI